MSSLSTVLKTASFTEVGFLSWDDPFPDITVNVMNGPSFASADEEALRLHHSCFLLWKTETYLKWWAYARTSRAFWLSEPQFPFYMRYACNREKWFSPTKRETLLVWTLNSESETFLQNQSSYSVKIRQRNERKKWLIPFPSRTSSWCRRARL